MAPNTTICSGSVTHDETQLWKDLSVDSWKNSVRNQDSVFYDLYNDTRRRVIDACHKHTYDVVVEVGCGTGEVIGFLKGTGTPLIGVDINEDFIDHCKATYKDEGLEFHVADAMKLDQWWTESGYDKKYKAPLMVCPNNTIMIMPEEIRDTVIEKMRVVAGIEGRIVVTYWNGRMFAHGVMGYYRKNSDLCGTFDLTDEHVDWENKKIETRTSYKSEWPTAQDVCRWMASLHIDVDVIEPELKDTPEKDHIAEVGMGVYLWLKGVSPENSSVGSARDYYDSKDSQAFYRTVWGENNTHVGRHDLVAEDSEFANADLLTKICKAQELQEECFMNIIKAHYGDAKVRCMDMGCGYGGLLRNMAKNDMIWSAVGVDISGEMIDAAARLSKDQLNLLTFFRESYMNTSVPADGIDLCISTESFLHVGPGFHEAVLREAWRVLRPGGRLIFTDIVGHPSTPPEAKVLYERIGLQSFQTVKGYFETAKKLGFGELSFEDHSENVSTHYGMVLEALEELWEKKEINIREESKDRMADGLTKWRDLAPLCLQWGVISMRKLEHTEHSVLGESPSF